MPYVVSREADELQGERGGIPIAVSADRKDCLILSPGSRNGSITYRKCKTGTGNNKICLIVIDTVSACKLQYKIKFTDKS